MDGIEHVTALKNQARAIRLSAERLERLAKKAEVRHRHTPAKSLPNPGFDTYDVILLRRNLGEISHNITALTARFGKADR